MTIVLNITKFNALMFYRRQETFNYILIFIDAILIQIMYEFHLILNNLKSIYKNSNIYYNYHA